MGGLFQGLCARQQTNIPTELQFRQVQLSLNQTKIAKENKGLVLVGSWARLQGKKTKSQYEDVLAGGLKTPSWGSTSVLSCPGNEATLTQPVRTAPVVVHTCKKKMIALHWCLITFNPSSGSEQA